MYIYIAKEDLLALQQARHLHENNSLNTQNSLNMLDEIMDILDNTIQDMNFDILEEMNNVFKDAIDWVEQLETKDIHTIEDNIESTEMLKLVVAAIHG